MTNDLTVEQAVGELKAMKEHIEPHMSVVGVTAYDMAIKALEQQPNRCDSCTHSEEQDGSNCYECVKGMADNFEAQPKIGYISIDVNKLAKEVAEKALDEITYEGKTIREWTEIIVNQQPCEDCISREAVLDVINFEDKWLIDANGHNSNTHIVFSGLESSVKAIPPVTPQRPKGKWIYGEDNLGGTGRDGWYCNQCGHFGFWDYSSDMKSARRNLPNFCPNCGADMRGEKNGNMD